MSIGRYVAPFALGVAAGVMLHRYWPEIREKGGPILKKVVREGSNLFEKGREKIHQESEKFSDLVAEIREEEEAKAKTPPEPTPPAQP